VEVKAGDCRIIFDAGTGIRRLGEQLASESGKRASIFLSHFHWDHIHGFPFFLPAYDPEFDLRIIGPAQEGTDMESLIRGQMGPLYFPVPYEALLAKITFQHLDQGDWEHDGIKMRSMRMRHTAFTVGYRVEAFGKSVVFIPDNELVGGEYPVPRGWRDGLIEFVSGADLLFHDAMFTEEEYRGKEGWGHSTYSQVLELAGESGVERLHFFHHHPARTDQELDDIVQLSQEEAAKRGLDMEVVAAEEGSVLTLG
jgi:phosphoribosyl 1,2-cyclic phosphodiesterase